MSIVDLENKWHWWQGEVMCCACWTSHRCVMEIPAYLDNPDQLIECPTCRRMGCRVLSKAWYDNE